MTKEDAIRHCIACCDGALTDAQRRELSSRIGGAIEAEREVCAATAENFAEVAARMGGGVTDAAAVCGERIAEAIRARSET